MKRFKFENMAQYIKQGREDVGLTQHQLAKKLGYDTSQFISNIERGLCSFPIAKFKKISKIIKSDEFSSHGLMQAYLKDTARQIEKELGMGN